MSSSNRRPYLTSNVLNQDFLDDCHDNLTCQLEVAVDIETPTGFIYASDRNKYIGGIFYEALLVVPSITRTIGDWLSPELTFSELSLELSNVDGRFNRFLPGGDDYDGWIGKSIVVKIGLRNVSATYFVLFQGQVSQVGGFGRSTTTIILRARDSFEKLATNFPSVAFGYDAFPKIEEAQAGKAVPIILGDWTVDTNTIGPSVPATIVNGADPLVLRFENTEVLISQGSPAVCTIPRNLFETNDVIQFATDGDLPHPLKDNHPYYVQVINADTFAVSEHPSDPPINTTTAGSGNHTIRPDSITGYRNAQCRITNHALTTLHIDGVQVRRGDQRVTFETSDIVNVGVNLNTFEIKQNADTQFEGQPFTFKKGDLIFVYCKGLDLGSYDDNIIAQARYILETFGGALPSEFNANWDSFRDRPSIAAIKSRVWIQNPEPAIRYALSMLEQVRLEMFVDRNRKITLSSLRIEEFTNTPVFILNGFDIERGSFKQAIDERNNFNRARAAYAFLPDINENGFFSPTLRNQDAIDQAGRQISKQLTLPNLYRLDQVTTELEGILRIASAYIEVIEVTATWRSLLRELSQLIQLQVRIGASEYNQIPCLLRSISYEPSGLKLKLNLWSFQMMPFPGYNPGYAGTVGGTTATITQE